MSDTAHEARALLARAQELHAAGDIDAALATARGAVARDPGSTDALVYLGTTLITRRLAFAEGLACLERAFTAAPDDAAVNYSLGWCYEFVAYRLEKSGRKPYRDPLELYELAAERLQRCIDLEPEPGLKEDAQDLLDSILRRF